MGKPLDSSDLGEGVASRDSEEGLQSSLRGYSKASEWPPDLQANRGSQGGRISKVVKFPKGHGGCMDITNPIPEGELL